MNGHRLSKLVAGAAVAATVLGPMVARAGTPVVTKPPATFNSATPLAPLDPLTQPKFVNELPQPIFYIPDKATFPGFDYYEIDMSPVEQIPAAFPQPPTGSQAVPPGQQWLGLVDPVTKSPLYTPLWGYGQWNNGGGLLGAVMGRPVATYPSMSFKAVKGTPVKVKWINHATDWHLLCPYPQDATQPCAIDRTLMGTQLAPGELVNPFGSNMQPDNAMVVHLHGGEIPPDSDGFAELWMGNATTAAAYQGGIFAPVLDPTTGLSSNLNPPFLLPAVSGAATDAQYAAAVLGFDLPGSTNPATVPSYQLGQLVRPTGDSIFYNYPMVQDAATIWYHDHALGKTRINVVAGPAGYFYVTDPAFEATLNLPAAGDCSNAGILGKLCYDVPIVLQDRAFNADGTINFPNGLGQAQPVAPAGMPQTTPLAPGPNPAVHPQWVPEYFGDHAVINGAIWPKLTVEPRAYRFRFLDGSNARCYTLSLKVPGALVQPSFTHIASEQGYLPAPATMQRFTMCPGERMEMVIDFSALAGKQVFLNNTAGAPFPAGPTPAQAFPGLATLLRFDVKAAATTVAPAGSAGVFTPTSWTAASYNSAAAAAKTARLPTAGTDPISGLPVVTREMTLNEVLDLVTGAPLRVQIDAKPFEALVTETPKKGSVEVWKIINTTVDAHPMHLHLVQFQVVSRQPFNVKGYRQATGLNNLAAGGPFAAVPIAPYLFGGARGPDANETGWKDTAKSFPGEVLTVVARWDGRWPAAPHNDLNTGLPLPYWESVTSGPYVWHCHIVDHEDNEMMRPTLVLP
jgi:FtsP/CotA-like multicopper oxidase with cupredoxin domain